MELERFPKRRNKPQHAARTPNRWNQLLLQSKMKNFSRPHPSSFEGLLDFPFHAHYASSWELERNGLTDSRPILGLRCVFCCKWYILWRLRKVFDSTASCYKNCKSDRFSTTYYSWYSAKVGLGIELSPNSDYWHDCWSWKAIDSTVLYMINWYQVSNLTEYLDIKPEGCYPQQPHT